MRTKKMALVAAAAAVLAMPANVMASGSISGAVDYNNVTAATESEAGTTETTGETSTDGSEAMTTDTVGVTLSPVEADTYEAELQAQVDAMNSASADATLLDVFQSVFEEDELPLVDVYVPDGEVVEENMDLSEFKFLSPVMDMQLETEPTKEEPVEVTFTANNMTDDIEVFVLHFCSEHDWEALQAEKVSDNQLTAGFHSASPVALIYRELPAEETETDTDVTAP